MEKTEFTQDDVIKYNTEILPPIQNVEPIYSIVARARSYRIKGGDDMTIDVYLTGIGIPEASKLVVLWSSPNVVDPSKGGELAYCIKVRYMQIDGKGMRFPLVDSKFTEDVKFGATGGIIHLHEGYFLPWPMLPVPKGIQLGLPVIVGERESEGHCPVSISLRTLNKAKPGDYAVDLVLTYTHRNIVKQASDKVNFHVTCWWDRNQWWIITVGSITAFALLVLTAISIIG